MAPPNPSRVYPGGFQDGAKPSETVTDVIPEDDRTRDVRERGLEPLRSKAQEPKSCVSANFTTPAEAEFSIAAAIRHSATVPRTRVSAPHGPDAA